MKKIFVAVSLLATILFLVSCAPQLTDEELEAELAKLTPEQREAIIKDLEGKEKSAFAGQAVSAGIASKYGLSARVATAPKSKLQAAAVKLKSTSTAGLASTFCAKPENIGKKTQYCAEYGSEIRYQRFRCVSKPAGNLALPEIDTTYEKSLLYKEVDSCPEILATFLDKPEYATIGCYDSDGGIKEFDAGYVEIIQLQTGNKAPSAPSAAAQPVTEVDACSGTNLYQSVTGSTEGCFAGYSGEGYPPDGYTEVSCVAEIVGTVYDIVGTKLFERKCPQLFEIPAIRQNTVIIDNCPYNTGYKCWNGKCDQNIPATTYINNKEVSCKDTAKCVVADHSLDTKVIHGNS